MTTKPVRRRVRPAATPLPLPHPAGEDLAALRNSMRIAEVPTDSLRPPEDDVRRRNQRLLASEKAVLERFDQRLPIVAAPDGTIMLGVTQWEAAKELGRPTVTVIYALGMTDEERTTWRIHFHKRIMDGEWNEQALRNHFLKLSVSLDFKLDLDLGLTGFTTREADAIVLKEPAGDGGAGGSADGDEAEEQARPAAVAVSRLGDLWLIGEHRVLCGNSLEEESYSALLGGELAQMVVCDGPYNCPIRGFVSSRKDAREFQFGIGEMSSEEFIAFERRVMGHLVNHSIDGSIHYHFIDWRSVYEMIGAGREEYTEHRNVLVWVKGNASRGWYRSQYELCCVFKSGTAPHITTFGIEKGARWRSNVLMGYPSCNSFGSHRDEDLADHPTVKGTSLVADLMRDCSSLGGCIVDAFGGSGTTLLAAELTHRRARVIEIDPLYVDVIIRRAGKRCGLDAILAATGQTFEEVARERLGDAVVDEEDLLGLGEEEAEDGADDAHDLDDWAGTGEADADGLGGEADND